MSVSLQERQGSQKAHSARAEGKRDTSTAVRTLLLRVAAIVILFAAWQGAAASGIVNKTFSGEPSLIFQSFYHGIANGSLLTAAGNTLYETVVGYVIGAVCGIAVALFFQEVPVFAVAMDPIISALNTMPRIALAPLFIIWFGLGANAKIAVAVTFVFFIMLANTTAGLKSATRDHLLLAKLLGEGRWRTFRDYVLPGALPSIFAGLQLSLVYALLGTVAAEIIAGNVGLGAYMETEASVFAMNAFFGGMLLLVLIAGIISLLLRRLERHLLTWRQIEMRGLEG